LTWWSWWAGVGLARALVGHREDLFLRIGIPAWWAWVTVLTSGTRISIPAWLSCGTWWSLLARTALIVLSLTGGTEEDLQTVSLRVARAAALHVQHVLPHLARTSLAILDLALYGSLHGLHVVENQRECDEASGDSDSAEHHGAEGDRLEAALGLWHAARRGLVEPLVLHARQC
jgi:hypothetical protein